MKAKKIIYIILTLFIAAALSSGCTKTLKGDNALDLENELIDRYAPNFKSVIDKMPQIQKGLILDDGGIYSFPSITDGDYYEKAMASKLFINETWLKKVG